MAPITTGDIAAGRLSSAALAGNFADLAPAPSRAAALLAADRCYLCYNAPCIQACPTSIDIPGFIRRIASDDLRGAAMDILTANPLGGICARACPTDILCEGACVHHHNDHHAVEIAALQRYATDWVFDQQARLFERAADTGHRVAILGSGPAGLACAHGLACAGHRVTIYEPLEKPGGLNEYGIAAYKVNGFAPREIEWLLSVGGIEIVHGVGLGMGLSLAGLRRDFDAVFLAIGLGGVNLLNLEGDDLPGVSNAVDFIAGLRQSSSLASVPVGRRVVVIGGGNTAIDAAVQSRKLGAESVTLAYRRDADAMGATAREQAFAREQGVQLLFWAQPLRFLAEDGVLAGVEFEHTGLDDHGRLAGKGERFVLPADVALKAVGQVMSIEGLETDNEQPGPRLRERRRADGHGMQVRDSRIIVDDNYATSLAGVWAGGDCVAGKTVLTVQAAEDGKRAAQAIDRVLMGRP